MRVWVGISIDQFLIFDRTGNLNETKGFAVTPSWMLAQVDQDEEVLEAQILELASAANPIVLVVQAPAQELSKEQVQLLQAISEPQIRAIFVSSPQEPDEMLWFGPTERSEVRDFLGLDTGS